MATAYSEMMKAEGSQCSDCTAKCKDRGENVAKCSEKTASEK